MDRNNDDGTIQAASVKSLSARRAWIEMQQSIQLFLVLWGSLSARRAWIEIRITIEKRDRADCRSPQGERG